MKVLLLSCKNFNSKIKKLATRPETIEPEPITQKEYKTDKSIVTLITVEENDNLEECSEKLKNEILVFSKDTGIQKIVIFPFGHLSNKLASSEETKNFMNMIQEKLRDLEVIRVHFGSHKSLLLNVYGHKGNVRFREF